MNIKLFTYMQIYINKKMQMEDNTEEIEKMTNISKQFDQIKESLFSFKQIINSFQTQIKQLEKNINKELNV